MSTNKQTTIRTDVEAGTVPEEPDNEPIGDTDDDDDESEVDEYAEAKAHLARDPVGTVWEALLNLTQIAADKTREAKDLEARVTAPVQQTVNDKAVELRDIIDINVSRIVELVTKNDAATRQRLAQLANVRAAKDAREAEREKRDSERDRRLADLEAALRANTERSTKDTDARIAALEDSIRDKTSRIADLVSERDKRDAELEKKDERIAELEAAALRANVEPTSSDIERDQRMANIEAAFRANIETTTNARISELENSISDKTSRIAELVSDRETKDLRIAELEAAARANVESIIKDTERRIADLEAAVRTHGESTTKDKDTRIAELQDNIGDKKLRIADLSKQLEDKDRRIASLESSVRNMTTRNSQLSSTLAEKDARIAEDAAKIKKLKHVGDHNYQLAVNAQGKAAEEEEKAAELESTMQREREKTANLESTIRMLRKEAAERKKANDKRITKLKATIARFNTSLPFWMRPAQDILANLFESPPKPVLMPYSIQAMGRFIGQSAVKQTLRLGFTYRRRHTAGGDTKLYFE